LLLLIDAFRTLLTGIDSMLRYSELTIGLLSRLVVLVVFSEAYYDSKHKRSSMATTARITDDLYCIGLLLCIKCALYPLIVSHAILRPTHTDFHLLSPQPYRTASTLNKELWLFHRHEPWAWRSWTDNQRPSQYTDTNHGLMVNKELWFGIITGTPVQFFNIRRCCMVQ